MLAGVAVKTAVPGLNFSVLRSTTRAEKEIVIVKIPVLTPVMVE